MSGDNPLDQVHPNIQSFFGNSVIDTGAVRVTRMLDNSLYSLMNKPAEGEFLGVCLSGMRTEDNVTGTDPEDGTINSDYIIVRPVNDNLVSTPDPTDNAGLEGNDLYNYIRSSISLHAVEFLAKHGTPGTDLNKPDFGQYVQCYYESGGSIPRDPRKLRYKSLSGLPSYHSKFRALLTVTPDSVLPGRGSFEKDSLPAKIGDYDIIHGTPKHIRTLPYEERQARGELFTEQNLSANIMGKRNGDPEEIVMHYVANSPSDEISDALLSENTSKNRPYGYHYMVGRKGDFIESVPPDHTVAHAVLGNKKGIGIGILNFGFARPQSFYTVRKHPDGPPEGYARGNNGWVAGPNPSMHNKEYWFEKYTPEQIEAASTIAAKLCKDYNIGVDKIITHHEVSKRIPAGSPKGTPGGKADTGPAFEGGNELTAFRNLVQRKIGLLGRGSRG